jgi:hypothetical protein
MKADFYAEQVLVTVEEGERKTISVNVYERNLNARKKCIENYCVECHICEMNFKGCIRGCLKGIHSCLPHFSASWNQFGQRGVVSIDDLIAIS